MSKPMYNKKEIALFGCRCGLVALVMASQLLGGRLSVDTALNVAREKQFSGRGEMFSAQNMKELAELLGSFEAAVLFGLRTKLTEVINHLMSGWPLLVPYDADANHEPVIKNGHRAHWAVILGFCFLKSVELEQDEHVGLKPLLKYPDTDILSILKDKSDHLFFLAKQGKSKYTKWWSFDNLCRSNQGLERVNPKIEFSEHRLEYVLPKNGNLKESLADRFLMIKPK